jgi:hypothetical protein
MNMHRNRGSRHLLRLSSLPAVLTACVGILLSAFTSGDVRAAAPDPKPPFFEILTQFPTLDGNVNAVALDKNSNTLYIGGTFTMISNQARARLAAFNASTGALLPWNPGANGTVHAIAVSGGIVYVGGEFQQISSLPKVLIAAVNASTGALLEDWGPPANAQFQGATVNAIEVTDSAVYGGGVFSGTAVFLNVTYTFTNLASFERGNGRFLPWNPILLPAGAVTSLSVASDINIVYAAGTFTSINGETRNGLAAIDMTAGTPTNWNPAPVGAVVSSLLATDDAVYIGGTFAEMGSALRNNLAAVNVAIGSSTGTAQAWDPNVTGAGANVNALNLVGSTLYIGGQFSAVGVIPRTNLAAVSTTTGAPTVFDAALTGPDPVTVNAIGNLGASLFVGGSFTSISGEGVSPVARKGLAGLVDVSLDPPTIKITGKKERKTNKSKMTIKGKASDLGKVVRVEVKVNGKSYRKANGTTSWSFTANLKVGKNRIRARAFDNSGNVSNVEVIKVTRFKQ